MATKDVQTAAWELAKRQHWAIRRGQLRGLGFTAAEIRHRLEDGRLHPIWHGVYAVGRPNLTYEGLLMAAVLACGIGAALSHLSAAWLWGLVKKREPVIEVSVPADRNPRRAGLRVHRRAAFETTRRNAIPITTPVQTLIDLSRRLNGTQLERAVNEAINRDLTDPDRLRAAGLPEPLTQAYVNGYRVDFYFPEHGIVVEADSLRFHRTPAQQRRDRERDQAHAMAGLIPLRFTHAQIAHEPLYVRRVLETVRARVAS